MERVTPHENNFNISKTCPPLSPLAHILRSPPCSGSFIFETGYSSQGKNVAKELAYQQKKKTIFKIPLAFPYMTNRIEVSSSSEVSVYKKRRCLVVSN